MDANTAVHRALSSPVRARLLDLLRAGPGQAHALAEQMGLHISTVRSHLSVLEEAGLVAASPENPDGPGRPALLYRATTAQPPPKDDPGYRLLAEILASHMAATLAEPETAAAQAGEAWGRFLVGPLTPFHSLSPAAAIERVLGLLEDRGFQPALQEEDPTEPRILLHRCPFADVAREHQEVVCSVHFGLIRGALSAFEAPVEVRALLPFVEPDVCVAHLAVG